MLRKFTPIWLVIGDLVIFSNHKRFFGKDIKNPPHFLMRGIFIRYV
jgi:hypothetical protein